MLTVHVAVIALGDVLRDLLVIGLYALFLILFDTASRALLNRGGQIYLHLCVRKHVRADVAAVHNYVLCLGKLALQVRHLIADVLVHGRCAGHVSDLFSTDQTAHILPE